ncbi:MAG: hypothetical protein SNH88_08055 [Rikenellaceae bacterium]
MQDIVILSSSKADGQLLSLSLWPSLYSHRLLCSVEELKYCDDCLLLLLLGISAQQALRATRALRSPATTFFLTEQRSSENIEYLLCSGVDQYMTLPISLVRLRAKVEAVLNSLNSGICRG